MDLVGGRARAEATLRSTCIVTRPDGEGTVDPDTHQVTPAGTVTVWEGPCTVAPVDSTAVDTRAGRQLEGRRVKVAVPVDGTEVAARGDTVTVTVTDDPAVDPGLVGVPFTVAEVEARTRMVLRRLHCVDTRGTDGVLP